MKKYFHGFIFGVMILGVLTCSQAHSSQSTKIIHLDLAKGARNGVAFRALIDKSVGKNVSISGYLAVLVQTQGLAALFGSESEYERMINNRLDPDTNSWPVYTSIYFDVNETLVEYEKYQGKKVELTDVLLPSINDDRSMGAILFSIQTKIRYLGGAVGGPRVGIVKRKIIQTDNLASSAFLKKVIEEVTGAQTNTEKERLLSKYALAEKLDETEKKRARYVLFSGPYPLYKKFTSVNKLDYFTYEVKEPDLSFPEQFSCACAKKFCPKNPIYDADLPYPVNKIKMFCLRFTNYYDLNSRRDNWLTDFYE